MQVAYQDGEFISSIRIVITRWRDGADAQYL